MFDIYNIFNGSNIGVMVLRYGPAGHDGTKKVATKVTKNTKVRKNTKVFWFFSS